MSADKSAATRLAFTMNADGTQTASAFRPDLNPSLGGSSASQTQNAAASATAKSGNSSDLLGGLLTLGSGNVNSDHILGYAAGQLAASLGNGNLDPMSLLGTTDKTAGTALSSDTQATNLAAAQILAKAMQIQQDESNSKKSSPAKKGS